MALQDHSELWCLLIEADPGDGPDERLPERLFATDRYPSRRLKVYSSLEYLVVIRDVLRGTPELDRILGSCFGKLFELPARRCSYSSVMIHAMLARQVVTKKRYEVWPVFGGNPFRFSMVEFASVTGLPCGEFDDGYAVDYQPTYKDEDFAYWDKLFEGKRDITIPEVVKMVVEDKSISRGRRLKLCLIIIVDGVLIASTQPAKPTPKHVKLVENLKDFFGFQWGRESFYWTVSTMIPGKKILGKRDDPNGEFCSKLRQKTKKMSGLPLALQLVIYEAIPQLLSRLGGNDELKLIDCERLPQHTGLNLVDVLKAEHNPELIVQPMMEVGPEKQDGWGVWDDEINDRRVNYMVGLLEGGHKFKKAVWGGGDAQEVLYDHEERKKARKRKRQGACSRTNVAAGPVLKQRRVSTYFRKPTLVDDEKHDELAARVTELEKVVAWMRRRLGRRKRTGATLRKERAAVAEEDALSAEEKEEHPDNPEDAGDPGGDVGPGRETAADGSEDESITDGRGEGEMGYSKEDSEDEDKEVDRESNSEAMDVEVGQSSPEGPPPVLVPLKEGDGVPLQWVESGVTDKRGGGHRATTSKALYRREDDRSSVAGGSGELGGIDRFVKDEDLMDSDGLDKLVGVIFSAHGSGSAEGELGSESKRVTEGADEGEQEERKKSDGDETAGGSTNIVEVEEELVSENAEAVVPATESVEVQDGEESKEMVTYLSDSSPCAPSEKHKPVEAEANLASLLLAKADFTLEQIVPDVEDIDFGYFETVLQANPKVLHLGVVKSECECEWKSECKMVKNLTTMDAYRRCCDKRIVQEYAGAPVVQMYTPRESMSENR
ncbi:hypothetical protein Bca52824_027041 [Brassica carinata]|uniref:DUF1985 domain-containing protein n=1 Tax=Brassica carinata TaxID=52824 RepID=A0A8X7SJ04_BRACI|nr:hypothetical protein Bca52824_027041 [Brassica carinata]